MIAPFDVQRVRAQFPILQRKVHGKSLIYLDNAASAQKPDSVIDAMSAAMRGSYANVHRGLHTLANETTEAYESAREAVRRFINARTVNEVVFAKGATNAINIVAAGICARTKPGDEIVLSVLEHHSNIVPWHFLRKSKGAVLRWVGLQPDGSLDMAQLERTVGPKTRLIAISHMSNVLGTVIDIPRIASLARSVGAELLVDGCQAIVNEPVDVQALGADYYVFSAHKLYGPTGIGVLYGRAEKLNELPPMEGGGEMISEVSLDDVSYNDPPHRFEAGTPPIIEAIGLGASINWLSGIDRAGAGLHKQALLSRATQALRQVNGLRIHGEAIGKGPIVTFSVDGVHPHDIAQIVDQYGVAIRAGHHCAQPLMAHLGVSSTARASFAPYNTVEEVDFFVEAVQKARFMLT